MERVKSAKLFQFLMAFSVAITVLLVVAYVVIMNSLDLGTNGGGIAGALVSIAIFSGLSVILAKFEFFNSVFGFFASTLCLYFARKRKVKVLSIICMIFHTLIIAILLAVLGVSDMLPLLFI